MSEETRMLVGCPSMDAFRRMHKDSGKGFWGLDYDFVWLGYLYDSRGRMYKAPVAVVDYRRSIDEKLEFSHVCAYNHELKQGKRVFIIAGPDDGTPTDTEPFYVSEFLGGDYRPDPVAYETVGVGVFRSLFEFKEWQSELRDEIMESSNPRVSS